MIQERHAGETEEPLRIERRIDSPANVVETGGDENCPVKPPPGTVQTMFEFIDVDEGRVKVGATT
jgi:hypothetical protein